MDISGILSKIDQELAALQSARAAIASIASGDSTPTIRRGRGRPPKNPSLIATPGKKRKLTAAGRARIAAAQKARWAVRKATTHASEIAPASKTAQKVVAPRSVKSVSKKAGTKAASGK